MKTLVLLMAGVNGSATLYAAELSPNQQLIVACHRLDIENVVKAIRNGASINASFGEGDTQAFQDKWDLGVHAGAKAWTPLMALANASRYPDPAPELNAPAKSSEWKLREKSSVPREVLDHRQRNIMTILYILLSTKCDLNVHDHCGATALYDAIENRHEEMAEVLIRFGASVNTKTRAYIDGPSDITPLHLASWSPRLTKLLLENGADPTAKDSSGDTPSDWKKRAAILGQK